MYDAYAKGILQKSFLTFTITALVFTAIACSTSSCMSWAWIGFKEPKPTDYVAIGNDINCMQIAMQNLDVRQRRAIEEAAADVCEILRSDQLKEYLSGVKWLANCDGENGRPEEFVWTEIQIIIIKKIPNYSVHPRKPLFAVAQSQRDDVKATRNRVAIDPERIEAWYSPNNCVKSELINTLAHETMHILSADFADRGHGTTECPDCRLVSYRMGYMVEKIWLSRRLNE